mgnify:CR=1 FL=1
MQARLTGTPLRTGAGKVLGALQEELEEAAARGEEQGRRRSAETERAAKTRQDEADEALAAVASAREAEKAAHDATRQKLLNAEQVRDEARAELDEELDKVGEI